MNKKLTAIAFILTAQMGGSVYAADLAATAISEAANVSAVGSMATSNNQTAALTRLTRMTPDTWLVL